MRVFAAVAALVVLAAYPAAGAVAKQGTGTFVVAGAVADQKGPLAGHTVVVSPIDENDGKPLNVFVPVGDGRMVSINPKTTTDAEGRFTITVPRSLFKGYKAGQLSLGVYQDVGGGSLSSSLDPAVVSFGDDATTIDVGKLILKPLSRK